MNKLFRRLYNSIDSFFDRRAILEEVHLTHEIEGEAQPRTARQAFEKVRPLAKKLDRKAELKMIVSQQGIDREGESNHWEFFFDLVDRKAKLVCVWMLVWDQQKDKFGSSRLETTILPFPSPDNPIRKMVHDGQLLYQQLAIMWRRECERLPSIPDDFRDTKEVIPALIEQGLDILLTEFSLSTGQSLEGNGSWKIQTRDKTFYVPYQRKGSSG